ncbi:hypothetical protein H0H81_011349 [Sphagnurus paluster]|uniref:F-box/LRR-repeat protein n=1 Tax=Sphagnurus paluster TaxID=117069 RepID=A0A9P7FWP7_9AGAR|nr:hypothetical protein H0H81_011349 [Sphagnurus paluster]
MALGIYRPVRILLPKLESFSTEFEDPNMKDSMEHIQPLLGSSIDEIYINTLNVTPGPTNVEDFVVSLARLCPNIGSLNVECPPDFISEPLSAAIRELVCRLHQLRVINVARLSLTPELVIHLLKSNSVQYLQQIEVSKDIRILELKKIFLKSHDIFPKLVVLEFCAHSWELAADVLDLFECHKIHQLVVNSALGDWKVTPTSIPQTLTSFAKFSESLSRHPSVSSITCLSLSGSISVPLELPGQGLRSIPSVFKCLLHLKSIQSLHLSLGCESNLDDPWLAEAAPAWPHLRLLKIQEDGSLQPSVTLAGLLPLLKFCPKLSYLTIPINAKPFSATLLSSAVINTTIATSLAFPASLIESPSKVFRCLTFMFPMLHSIECSGVHEQGNQDWKKVQKLISHSSLR